MMASHQRCTGNNCLQPHNKQGCFRAAQDPSVKATTNDGECFAGAPAHPPYPTLAQVLTPMRKGAAGVAQLNARLQALLNPPAPDRAELPLGGSASNGVVLRVGDRVIQVQPLV